MNTLINQVKEINRLYISLNKDYSTLKTMVKRHSCILQKIILSEQLINQAFILIAECSEGIETKRQFNKIIKGIKNE